MAFKVGERVEFEIDIMGFSWCMSVHSRTVYLSHE